jgi:peptidoglycan/xylan/chitin deacetylase (PgdA/CDA1 family)
MHDGAYTSRESTVRALPILLDSLKSRGFRFVTVSELLGIKGDVPAPKSGITQ